MAGNTVETDRKGDERVMSTTLVRRREKIDEELRKRNGLPQLVFRQVHALESCDVREEASRELVGVARGAYPEDDRGNYRLSTWWRCLQCGTKSEVEDKGFVLGD